MDAPLTLDELKTAIRPGAIDTVLLAMTDMQGRLEGKRLSAQHFLERWSSTARRPATTCWPSTSR